MIGKVIKRKKGLSSSVRRLNMYILNSKDDHKVQLVGTLGIEGDIKTATSEMEWTASQNTRSRDPFMHCLLSWREGEQPSPEQVRRAAKIALEELGLSGQQCVYALHQNTENLHLHISVSRIDRVTHKAIDAAGGYTKRAMERAARRIEFEQGWSVERNAWTTYDGDKLSHDEPEANGGERKITQETKDMEALTGEKSAQRIARERLADKKFESWNELHKTLSELGMRYEKKGSGAVIIVGDVPIKASSAGKRFALSYLEKQLGEFAEADRYTKVCTSKEHISEPVKASESWSEYEQKRSEYYKSKRVATQRMREKIAQERSELAARQREERERMFGGDHQMLSYGELLARRSELAAKHKGERIALDERHKVMRGRFAEMYPKFPSYKDWLKDRDLKDDIDAWRARAEDAIGYAGRIVSADQSAPSDLQVKDIRGFRSRAEKSMVVYVNRKSNANAFVDRGAKISVISNDEPALLAAMQLASQKWGTIQLSGTEEYKRKCLALAVENGIKIANAELRDECQRLQEAKRSELTEVRAERTEAIRKDIRAYCEAVGAKRFHVSAIQMFENGSRRGFMVDKRDGAPDGFTPQELDAKIPRMSALEQKDGRNIYLTPISDDKHHILIDDMTNETLAELITDGYEPAAIIESSPGNWQALITIPKLGTDMDREIGNEIVSRLNKRYGDPKVSGEIHAHRAPGFENRKPKHQHEDGTYPEVKLARAEKVECQKTIALAKEVFAELDARRRESNERLDRITVSLPSGSLPMATAYAYELHFRDVLKIQERLADERGKSVPDISRIDGMVAVRLRATGHSKESVQAAVEAMSPKLREAIGSKGTHVWPDYAARTAEYAFGYSGDKSISRSEKYVAHWKEMERAAIPKQHSRKAITKNRSRGDMER